MATRERENNAGTLELESEDGSTYTGASSVNATGEKRAEANLKLWRLGARAGEPPLPDKSYAAGGRSWALLAAT